TCAARITSSVPPSPLPALLPPPACFCAAASAALASRQRPVPSTRPRVLFLFTGCPRQWPFRRTTRQSSAKFPRQKTYRWTELYDPPLRRNANGKQRHVLFH